MTDNNQPPTTESLRSESDPRLLALRHQQERMPAHAERAGPYRLLEILGEGGMAVVYLAEQTEPIHRRVAVKLIKPGVIYQLRTGQ